MTGMVGGKALDEHPTALTVFILAPLFFLMPFGEWQNLLLAGLTAQQVIVPAVVLLIFIFQARRFAFHPFAWLMLLFVMLTTPSFLTSTEYFPLFLAIAGGFVMVSLVTNGVESFRDIQWLLRAYLAGMAVISVAVAVALLRGPDLGTVIGHPLLRPGWFGLPFLQGTESNSTAFAIFYAIGLPIAFSEFLTARRWGARIAFGALFLLMGVELLITFTRSAMLGAAISVSIVAYYTLSRRAKIILATLIGVVAFFLGVLILGFLAGAGSSSNEIIRGINGLLSMKEESTMIHGQVFEGAVDLAFSSPPWGLGFLNLPDAMRLLTGHTLSAHNSYLTIWIEFGLLAALVFTAFYLGCIYESWRTTRLSLDNRERSSLAAVTGIAISLALSSLFHDDYVNSAIWSFFGLALATGWVKRPGTSWRRLASGLIPRHKQASATF